MKAAAILLATAILTGCASPQKTQPRLSEGPQVGAEHIESAKTDAYTVLMRVQTKVRGWLVFSW